MLIGLRGKVPFSCSLVTEGSLRRAIFAASVRRWMSIASSDESRCGARLGEGDVDAIDLLDGVPVCAPGRYDCDGRGDSPGMGLDGRTASSSGASVTVVVRTGVPGVKPKRAWARSRLRLSGLDGCSSSSVRCSGGIESPILTFIGEDAMGFKFIADCTGGESIWVTTESKSALARRTLSLIGTGDIVRACSCSALSGDAAIVWACFGPSVGHAAEDAKGEKKTDLRILLSQGMHRP
jgi:hypothetical protein